MCVANVRKNFKDPRAKTVSGPVGSPVLNGVPRCFLLGWALHGENPATLSPLVRPKPA